MDVGDARATDMRVKDDLNPGQRVRETFDDKLCVEFLGFGNVILELTVLCLLANIWKSVVK